MRYTVKNNRESILAILDSANEEALLVALRKLYGKDSTVRVYSGRCGSDQPADITFGLYLGAELRAILYVTKEATTKIVATTIWARHASSGTVKIFESCTEVDEECPVGDVVELAVSNLPNAYRDGVVDKRVIVA